MGGGLYTTDKKDLKQTLDLKRVKPYGDTMNDGKIQVSFTLPVEDGEKVIEAAKKLAEKMGLKDPNIVYHTKLDEGFTYIILYGTLKHTVDFTKIKVESVNGEAMTMEEINSFIKVNFERKIIVIGATTGSDAHTVGIDAIMNMKGFAGHYGLERYEMIEAYNLGSQVTNEEFVKKAIELNADILLISQTVTQKNIHIKTLTNLVDLLEAEGIRDKVILICGGARISNELAKELGYDAGFGPGTYADRVATYVIKELFERVERQKKIS
ncbi:MAG: B12-binding domain-containing protein [Promethearchaeota archaeon]